MSGTSQMPCTGLGRQWWPHILHPSQEYPPHTQLSVPRQGFRDVGRFSQILSRSSGYSRMQSSYFSLLISFSQEWSMWAFLTSSRVKRNVDVLEGFELGSTERGHGTLNHTTSLGLLAPRVFEGLIPVISLGHGLPALRV